MLLSDSLTRTISYLVAIKVSGPMTVHNNANPDEKLLFQREFQKAVMQAPLGRLLGEGLAKYKGTFVIREAARCFSYWVLFSKHADNLLHRQLSTSSCLRGPEFLSTADEAVRDIPRCHMIQETF